MTDRPPPRRSTGGGHRPPGGDEPRAARVITYVAGRLVPVLSAPPAEKASSPLPPPPKQPSYLRVGAERSKHLQTIIGAVVGSIITLASAGTPLVLWATTRASDKMVKDLRTDLEAETAARLKAEGDLRAFVNKQDASIAEHDEWWNDQDAINQTVAKQLPRTKKQTGPPGVGPAAKLRGKTAPLRP